VISTCRMKPLFFLIATQWPIIRLWTNRTVGQHRPALQSCQVPIFRRPPLPVQSRREYAIAVVG
jgi:hypothetical protein